MDTAAATDPAPSRSATLRPGGTLASRAAWPLAPWLLVYAVGVLAAARIRPEVVGANDASRYATMVALVEHHTFHIEGLPLARRTMDKVQVGEHEVSTKPPLLSTVGAVIYGLLHHLAGLSFARHERIVVPILVFLLCTLPLLVLLLLLHGLLRREGVAPGPALCATAVLGLATLLFPFGTILANHMPSTTALFAAFVCAREVVSGRRAGLRWVAATGLLACLAVTFELTAVLPVLVLSGYLMLAAPLPPGAPDASGADRPGRLAARARLGAALAAGAALPAATHLWLNVAASGGLLPVQLRPELWHYPGSYWNHPKSWDALREPKWRYAWHCFLGGRGLLTLSPVLVLAAPGLWRALGNRLASPEGTPNSSPRTARQGLGRAEAIAVLAGFAALATYIITATNNYGGGHYGMRWFLMMVPLLGLFLAPTLSRLWAGWPGRAILALLLLPSLYTAQIFWFGKPTVYELLLMRHGLLALPP